MKIGGKEANHGDSSKPGIMKFKVLKGKKTLDKRYFISEFMYDLRVYMEHLLSKHIIPLYERIKRFHNAHHKLFLYLSS